MRRHLPVLAAACGLLTLAACRPRALQRAAVAVDMQAAMKAFLSGQPLPPLAPDPERYGVYRPMIEGFYGHMTAIHALNEKITALSPTLDSPLSADQITNPAIRKVNHEKLAALIQDFGALVQQEDELAGPASEGIMRSLVPQDPEFVEGTVKAIRTKRDDVQFIIDTFKLKQEYYRRIDALIGMADRSVTGMAGDHKVLFDNPGAMAAYDAKVQELAAFEQDMNAKLRKVQALGKAVRKQQGI